MLRRRRAGALWGTLAVLHALWALEILLDLRHRFRAAAVLLLEDRGWYASRALWQSAAVVAALLLGAALVGLALRPYRRDGPALGAIAGTALALTLLAVETISLHRVDAVMYAEAGPLIVLAWLWIGAAAIVTGSAWAASPPGWRVRAGHGARAASRRDDG